MTKDYDRDRASHNKIDYESGTFSIKADSLYAMYKTYCSSNSIGHVVTQTAFGNTLNEMKLKDGSPAVDKKKSSTIFRVFTRAGVLEAIKTKVADCSDEMVEEHICI